MMDRVLKVGDTFTLPVGRAWWQFWKPQVERRRFTVTWIRGPLAGYEPSERREDG